MSDRGGDIVTRRTCAPFTLLLEASLTNVVLGGQNAQKLQKRQPHVQMKVGISTGLLPALAEKNFKRQIFKQLAFYLGNMRKES